VCERKQKQITRSKKIIQFLRNAVRRKKERKKEKKKERKSKQSLLLHLEDVVVAKKIY